MTLQTIVSKMRRRVRSCRHSFAFTTTLLRSRRCQIRKHYHHCLQDCLPARLSTCDTAYLRDFQTDCLRGCLPATRLARLPACKAACLRHCLRHHCPQGCLSARLPACDTARTTACLQGCLPATRPARPPACTVACLHGCLPARLSACNIVRLRLTACKASSQTVSSLHERWPSW